MFEKKEPFNWKPPVLILTGVAVLSGGIYLGAKTKDIGNEHVNVDKQVQQQVEKPVEKVKEVFELSKECEIWVEKKNEDGSESEKSPVMIGTVDNALLNKTEGEITAYLKDKYPDREVESISKYEIILSEVSAINDPSKIGKFSLEVDGEHIGLYKYDSSGSRALLEKTEIKIDSLPKTVQEKIQKGVVVNSQEEAYTKLEDFGS